MTSPLTDLIATSLVFAIVVCALGPMLRDGMRLVWRRRQVRKASPYVRALVAGLGRR